MYIVFILVDLKFPRFLSSELSLSFAVTPVALTFLYHYFVLLYHYLIIGLGTHLLGIFSESVSSSALGFPFTPAPRRIFFFQARDLLLATDCCCPVTQCLVAW